MMPFDEHGLGSMGGGGSVNGTFSLRPVGSNPFLQVCLTLYSFNYSRIWFNLSCFLSRCPILRRPKSTSTAGYLGNVVWSRMARRLRF